MIKKKSHVLVLLLTIGQTTMTLPDSTTDEQNPEDKVLRKKGCEKFCCLNVTGNETVGGDMTVGGKLTVNGQSNPGTITVQEDLILNGQSVAALFNFGSFYFEGVTRAVSNIIPGALIPFPTIGTGTTVTANPDKTIFTLPLTGTWIVSWTVSFSNATGTQPTTLALFLNGTRVTGSATKNSKVSGQMSNTTLISAQKGAIVSLKNTGSTTFDLTKGSISIIYNTQNTTKTVPQ
jgi:hypothetical protein